MSKHILREQRAIHVLPTLHQSRTSGETLPDQGLEESRRTPNSTRRYRPAKPAPVRLIVRNARTRVQHQEHKQKHRIALIAALSALGIALMMFSYLLGNGIGSLWQNISRDWVYGKVPTFHIDARVGHGDARVPSHFIAVNQRREVRIIEFPGNDASKALIYIGPTLQGENQEDAPVTLLFRDVNADRKPDMLIVVDDMIIGVLINTTIRDIPQFRPAKPDERVRI